MEGGVFMTSNQPLLGASVRMMLRSRGVIYAMVANPLQVVALGLLAGGLGFGIGDRSVRFFDFVLPGMAALSVLQLQDITVAIAASYRARGILRRLAVTPVSPARLIGAQVLSYLAIGLVAAGLALAIGTAMGAHVIDNAALDTRVAWVRDLMDRVTVDGREEHAVAIWRTASDDGVNRSDSVSSWLRR